MSTEPVKSPSALQLDYAKKIAARRKEELPNNVLTDKKACHDYLQKYAKNSAAPDAPKQIFIDSGNPNLPSEPQRNFATDMHLTN